MPAAVAPPPLTDPGLTPDRADRNTFSARAVALDDFVKDNFIPELRLALTNVETNANGAFADATTANADAISAAASSTAATATANVTEWVSGTSYSLGDNVWSPIDFFTYRRIVAGAGTTDPSADGTNWRLLLDASAIKNTPSGGITSTDQQSVNNELDTKKAIKFPTGTRMLFNQTSAPTGWTKDTNAALNDAALRIVTGTAGSGGSVAFTTAFKSQAVSGTNGASGATTLTTAQMPSHTHNIKLGAAGANGAKASSANTTTVNNGTSDAAGSGGSHNHGAASFTGNAINLAVKYRDFIIASKD